MAMNTEPLTKVKFKTFARNVAPLAGNKQINHREKPIDNAHSSYIYIYQAQCVLFQFFRTNYIFITFGVPSDIHRNYNC